MGVVPAGICTPSKLEAMVMAALIEVTPARIVLEVLRIERAAFLFLATGLSPAA